ncbi:hypothetical protein N7494_011417 [Penicillium frequentans]|uniref:Uncharacterized protein n=1 Tax=Penicillium frequentans TaxID=3151616 RepID=A0AAD6GA54_9EURO|nr:hypothetical protein N7494_011417 [Penicillium glabrum]
MSSLARPFELASITGNGIRTSEQSTSYVAQTRNLVKADSEPHLSIDRTRFSYNAIGIRYLASGTPLGGMWTVRRLAWGPILAIYAQRRIFAFAERGLVQNFQNRSTMRRVS